MLGIRTPIWLFHGKTGHANQIKVTIYFVTDKKISKVIDVVELDIILVEFIIIVGFSKEYW